MTHLQDILDIHFEPAGGTRYWLEQQERLHIDARREIASIEDLSLFGLMDVEALRSRPLLDFVPRRYHDQLHQMILSETGGTSGSPCRRVYSEEDFNNGFVKPWLTAVERHHFPHGGHWLFVGPSGPHIIDRSARAMARSLGSLEPFTLDCDVRWIKRQAKGSIGYTLYLDHVMSQAMNIIQTQEIDTLFTTPPLLLLMGEQMGSEQRQAIRGIHTGGMAMDENSWHNVTRLFPKAVVLPGYGNSLFGVCFPHTPEQPDVFEPGNGKRLRIELVPWAGKGQDGVVPTARAKAGERGRVFCHILDPTFLLINMLERETAVATPLPNGATGLTDIRPIALPSIKQEGVY